ncbi:hypothetical protein OnM2_029009 [Erysiphe neolycopersici]|uniref:Uncharacterized protein n=1 Tax=Erysiphe neolycopersici TaxID=212602 RepID=A0A420HZJ9_9PEZI|nr:hypothetical protein OnM2_029009 [Erysiphe neolycopersici]
MKGKGRIYIYIYQSLNFSIRVTPYFEERSMPQNNAMEEISVQELIDLDKHIQDDDNMNAQDGVLDDYPLNEPLTFEASNLSLQGIDETKKKHSPTEDKILLSAHAYYRSFMILLSSAVELSREDDKLTTNKFHNQ